MKFHRCVGLLGCVLLLVSACSAADTDPAAEAGEETLASSSQPLGVGDVTNQVCMEALGPAECNVHDGTFVYTSGLCKIKVQQECTWLGGQCRCFVKVIGTMGPCANKGWGAFFEHC